MESLQLFLRDLLAADTTDLRSQVETLANLIAIAWGIHAVNWAATDGGLNQIFGVRPREIAGLWGIVCAPFLHGVDKNARNEVIDGSHLIGNTLLFGYLGWFIALQGILLFYIVSIAVMISSGLGTWLFGRGGPPHVGASGVLYGYMGFLLLFGLTSGQWLAFLIALVVLVLHKGSILYGMLPIYQLRPTYFFEIIRIVLSPVLLFMRPLIFFTVEEAPISWEMHLFGFIGGAVMGLAISDLKMSL
jgi:membrane associated rhomboid family serine protease